MEGHAYPIRIRFRGKEPDIDQKIRLTETHRYWRELHELYTRTRMRGVSPLFREMVLDEIRERLEEELQRLLNDVVRIEDQVLVKTEVDEVDTHRFVGLEWEATSDTSDVSISFDADTGTYIEALTLDASWVQLARWCWIETLVDDRTRHIQAEIKVLVNLKSVDNLFRRSDWFVKEYVGRLEYKLDYSDDGLELDDEALERIGTSLMAVPA